MVNDRWPPLPLRGRQGVACGGEFDRFWSLVEEAGITVVVHAGDSGYSSNGYADDGFTTNFAGGIPQPIKLLQTERPIEVFRRHIWINPFWEDMYTRCSS